MLHFFQKLRALLKRLIYFHGSSFPRAVQRETVSKIEVHSEIHEDRPHIKKRMNPSMRREQAIDWILDLMSHSVRHHSSSNFHKVELDYFDSAEPLIRFEEFYGKPSPGDPLIDLTLSPREVPNWDQSLIISTEDDDHKIRPDRFSLLRIRRVSLRQLRGAGKLLGAYATEMAIAMVRPDYSFRSGRIYFTWDNQKPDVAHPITWHWVSGDNAGYLDDLAGDNLHIQSALGWYAFSRTVWKVALGWPNCPRISFGTDPLGVREVFRLRDIPDGKQRRAALRHWVREHWRRKPNAEENAIALIDVRNYLRGAMRFTWNSLSCEIVPSETDRIKNLEKIAVPSIPLVQMR